MENEDTKDIKENEEIKEEIKEEKKEENEDNIEENKEEKKEENKQENKEEKEQINEIVLDEKNINEKRDNDKKEIVEENKEEIKEQIIQNDNKDNIISSINDSRKESDPIQIEKINISEEKQEINKNLKSIDDSKNIKITRIYIDKTSELNGKTLYHIKGDFIPKNKEVIRRYRDFDLLHIRLKQNWPGIFIPPIPEKKYFSSSTNQKVVEERLYQLENFLKFSSELSFIFKTPEFELFLDKDITDSDFFQSTMKKMLPYNYKQISENYTKYFSEYKKLKKEDLTDDKLTTLIGYVTGFIDKIQEYKNDVVAFGEIPKKNIYRETRIISHFTEFEKKAMVNYVNNDISLLYFYNKEQETLKEKKDRYDNLINHPYLLLSCWIRLKELELLSMREKLYEYKTLVSKKISYNNKLKELKQKLQDVSVGKVGFFEKIFKGDANKLKEKYEVELKNHTSETEYINNIVEILSDYISVEFYKYFKNLSQNFYHIVRNFSSTQRENSILAMDLWLKVKNNKEDDNQKINEIFKEKEEMEKNNDNNIEKKDN